MRKFLSFLLITMAALSALAQAPEAFKFQTVIRDGNGELLPNQEVALKFLIRQDAPDGLMVYSEQHQVTTNPSGLVNLQIGNGEVLSGDFGSINWGSYEYFLEEQIAIGISGDFQTFGVVQLLSVPYALHANTAGNGIQNMSTVERNALENPAVGMQIYNTTTNCLNYWSGSNWFETCGNCTPMPSQAVAGSDQYFSDETVATNLEANTPDFGTGTWSVAIGTGGIFDNKNNPFTLFTGQPCESYVLTWEISTSCGSTNDQVNIEFFAIPSTAFAGNDTIINDENLTINLNANIPEVGTGQWSILSGEGGSFADASNAKTGFTAQACEIYHLLWEIATACENSVDTLVVDFYSLPTTADAGEDQFGLGGTWTTLTANTPEIGTGQWTILSGDGGQITNPNSPTSVFLGQNMKLYELEWKIVAQCDTSVDFVSIAFGFTPFQECGDTLTDVRDGKKYKTVQIGAQCWMAENLNTGVMIDSTLTMSDNEVIEKYCFRDQEEYCDIYGGLYSWYELMNYDTIEKSSGICPKGWYIPSYSETLILGSYLGGNGIVGGTLKTTGTIEQGDGLWLSPNLGATNSSLFSGLPSSGYSQNTTNYFYETGQSANWWTSTTAGSEDAWRRYLSYKSTVYGRMANIKEYGMGVRCISTSLNTINQQPSIPIYIIDNNSINIPVDTIINWSCFDPENDPLTYDVYFGTESTPPQVATGIADTFYTPGTLQFATTYYWQIVAHDDQGNSTEGEVWSFMTTQQNNGFSLEFNGVDNTINLGNLEQFNDNGDVTIEAWIKFDNELGAGNVFVLGGNGHFFFGVDQLTKPVFSVVLDSAGYQLHYPCESQNSLEINVWNHIAGIFNNGNNTVSLFVNGILECQILTSDFDFYHPNSSNSNIGSYYQPYFGGCFNGKIAGVHLTQDIKYSGDFSPIYPTVSAGNAIGLWLFNEGEGNQVIDTSGNNNHGIMIGCDWVEDVPF